MAINKKTHHELFGCSVMGHHCFQQSSCKFFKVRKYLKFTFTYTILPHVTIGKHRCSHQRCSIYKKVVLKDFYEELKPFEILQNACNFVEKGLQHRCFPMNIVKILRTFIMKNIWERLLNNRGVQDPLKHLQQSFFAKTVNGLLTKKLYYRCLRSS